MKGMSMKNIIGDYRYFSCLQMHSNQLPELGSLIAETDDILVVSSKVCKTEEDGSRAIGSEIGGLTRSEVQQV